MSYNWCHGPNCHTNHTTSRVRGSNNRCLFDYLETHIQSIVAIAPRREALETPIKDPYKLNPENRFPQWIIKEKDISLG